MAITDKQRIDFLARQKFTRWVGYDTGNGYCVWPVFENGDLRAEIDWAIKKSAQQSVQSDICPACGSDGFEKDYPVQGTCHLCNGTGKCR